MREELIERIIDLTIKYQVFSDENTKSIQRNLLGFVPDKGLLNSYEQLIRNDENMKKIKGII